MPTHSPSPFQRDQINWLKIDKLLQWLRPAQQSPSIPTVLVNTSLCKTFYYVEFVEIIEKIKLFLSFNKSFSKLVKIYILLNVFGCSYV